MVNKFTCKNLQVGGGGGGEEKEPKTTPPKQRYQWHLINRKNQSSDKIPKKIN